MTTKQSDRPALAHLFQREGVHLLSKITVNRRALMWLIVGCTLYFIVALIEVGGQVVIGESVKSSVYTTAPGVIVYEWVNGLGLGLDLDKRSDSWLPMLMAYNASIEDSMRSLYDVTLKGLDKFQYPPSSLLLFDLIPKELTTIEDGKIDATLSYYLWVISLIAFSVTIGASWLLLEMQLARFSNTPSSSLVTPWGVSRGILISILGFFYYPLLKGLALGQAQTFLSCLVAISILAFFLGWKTCSGICIGLCCLFKPQYGWLLVWSVYRRQRWFTVGLASVVLLGGALSVARHGHANWVSYLELLGRIGRQGEAFWANQSMNGLVNRLLGNGDPLHFFHSSYAPLHPTVSFLTIACSLILLGLALRPWSPDRTDSGRPLDLMIVIVAVTLASPIAWEHHYGAFLPIFAAALASVIIMQPFGRMTNGIFACSYVACASVLLRPHLFYKFPVLGLVGSHMFFGGLVLFVMLLVLRQMDNREGAIST